MPEQEFNPEYTFENFVVGQSNRLAHATAVSVADRPGRTYNPLYIYGGRDLGKTHLLHAIWHLSQKRGHQAVYTTAEQFQKNYRKNGRLKQFRNHFQEVDLLLLDDIEFLDESEPIPDLQELFFHIFNELHEQNRQIVLTSSRAPNALPFEDRLISRFEGGLLAPISSPSREERMAILGSKADRAKVVIANDALDYIARRFPHDTRLMMGLFQGMLETFQRTNPIISMEMAIQFLNEIDSNRDHHIITAKEIVKAVEMVTRVSIELLTGPRRDRDIVLARHVAMYLIREETALSLADTGKALGNRDHSTATHACNRIADEVRNNRRLLRQMQAIREVLYHQSSC